ncbi:NAD-P-binding protein [Vararia minispora EC-137]|uniref:NAD-P-binding protein n=1 Tax=Vararia minispora EC-137 TaxID=1314806 RepID=A0ACB8QDH1_9AGAM|nr:NAD-P-binding protein [Vararia minispora EC-137]
MPDRPSVLILGGLNWGAARGLAALLVPLDGEPKVSYLRIVDKYSVHPPTTYIGSEFPKVLEKDQVEYRQANLTVPTAVEQTFDPPEGVPPYSLVFDFTGDINFSRPEQIQINQTATVAYLCGKEAARRGVKAYVRLIHPFYDCPEKGAHDEKETPKPLGVAGTWWHETMRILGAMKDLNLVIIRSAFTYGPYISVSLMSNVLTVASVYGYLKKPMKSLWSPGKHPMNTVHTDDVAGASYALALWMAGLGRAEADRVAGETIPFHNDPAKVAEVEGMPPADAKIVAPLFNLSDDNETTLLKAGNTMCRLFGATFDFYNFVTSAMFRFRLEDVVEEINEAHVGAWAEMLQKSRVPCANTTLTAYMDVYSLQKHTIAFANGKLKSIVGYNLKRPQMTQEILREIVDKWKEEGSWPVLDE